MCYQRGKEVVVVVVGVMMVGVVMMDAVREGAHIDVVGGVVFLLVCWRVYSKMNVAGVMQLCNVQSRRER